MSKIIKNHPALRKLDIGEYNGWNKVLQREIQKQMASVYDISQSRTTHTLDSKLDRKKRLFPYLNPVKGYHSLPKPKKRKGLSIKNRMQTHVRRYDQNQSVTVLSIRFASADVAHEDGQDQEEAYIKAQKNKLSLEIQENIDQQKEGILPFLKYKRYESPEQQLRNMGYNPDVRLASQVYTDKIQQKKEKYMNKMEAMKRDLENTGNDRRQNRMERCKIQVRILGEQIRRKREREILKSEEKKGRKLLQTLLRGSD